VEMIKPARMYIEEVGWENVGWIHLEGFCEHCNEFSDWLKWGEFV
jgi:hypothetical protein